MKKRIRKTKKEEVLKFFKENTVNGSLILNKEIKEKCPYSKGCLQNNIGILQEENRIKLEYIQIGKKIHRKITVTE